jgi:hypothetical protein
MNEEGRFVMPILQPNRRRPQLCVELPDGQNWCQPIKRLGFTLQDLPEQEDQIEGTKPQTNPWITADGIEPPWARDLELVAHIDTVLRQLTPEIQNDLLEALQRAVCKLQAQLPKGVTIHMGQR